MSCGLGMPATTSAHVASISTPLSRSTSITTALPVPAPRRRVLCDLEDAPARHGEGILETQPRRRVIRGGGPAVEQRKQGDGDTNDAPSGCLDHGTSEPPRGRDEGRSIPGRDTGVAGRPGWSATDDTEDQFIRNDLSNRYRRGLPFLSPKSADFHMRFCIIACIACLFSSGCTSLRLERSTANQARTLSDLQYRQVLDNLAKLYVDPWAVPSQVGLRDGSTQVADSGTAGLLTQTDLAHKFSMSPALNGTRSVVEQWGMLPVTDETNLRLLRMAYRRAAFGVDETLATDAEFRNQLAHELKGQIAVTEDLRRSTDAYYQSKVSRGLSEYYTHLAGSPGAAVRPGETGSMLDLQSSAERMPAPRRRTTGRSTRRW